jgi:hypothetical protein
MRRALRGLFLGAVLGLVCSLPARAADLTPTFQPGQRCGGSGGQSVDLSALSVNDGIWVEVEGRCLLWELVGNGTGILTVSACSRKDSTYCNPYYYLDSDGDGHGDTNTIDNATANEAGLNGCAHIARWARFNVDATCTDCELALCFGGE